MPARIRLELEAATRAHLQEHEYRHYELVRDDPRFVAWTGSHLGYRGEKYFDRVVALVKGAQVRKGRLKRQRLAEAEAVARPVETDAKDVARPHLRPADSTELGFSDLLGDLCEQRLTLRAEQAACLDDDGGIDDEKRFYRAARELRDIGKAIADLSKQYGALKSGESADALLSLTHEEFADQPERVDRVIEKFSDLIRHQSGLAAQSGASR